MLGRAPDVVLLDPPELLTDVRRATGVMSELYPPIDHGERTAEPRSAVGTADARAPMVVE